MSAEDVLLIGTTNVVASNSFWGEDATVTQCADLQQALSLLRSSGERFGIVVVQQSTIHAWIGDERSGIYVDSLRLILTSLRSARPHTIYLLDDEVPISAGEIEQLRQEFGLNLLGLHQCFFGSRSGSRLTKVRIDCTAHARIRAICSTETETGILRCEDESPGNTGKAVMVTTELANRGEDASSARWWRGVQAYGGRLAKALFETRALCETCQDLSECHVKNLMGSIEEDASADLQPLVAICDAETAKHLVPIELLHVTGQHGYAPMYLSRPVMHQLDNSKPPQFRPRLQARNALLINGNSNAASSTSGPLPGTENEISLLAELLNAIFFRTEGRTANSVLEVRTRDFENIDGMFHWIAERYPNQGWDVVHYVGHGRKNPIRQAGAETISFTGEVDWPCKDDSEVRISAQKLASHVENLKPKLVHLSCCNLGGTDGMVQFARVTPYVLGYRWTIRDDTAPRFAASFYSQWLLQGKRPSVALFATRRQFAHWKISAGAVLLGGKRIEK